jgi:hypothetical protein
MAQNYYELLIYNNKIVYYLLLGHYFQQFIGTSSDVIPGVMDPGTLESMVGREGLALAADLIVHHFRMATDYNNVV